MSKLNIFLSTRKISPIIIHSKIRSTLTTKSALGCFARQEASASTIVLPRSPVTAFMSVLTNAARAILHQRRVNDWNARFVTAAGWSWREMKKKTTKTCPLAKVSTSKRTTPY
ncbi:unnamed protein product [Albugo candida]|uniref:Uncharacterized protein n=1 Tax=Albugo candida TaxID=65357 RepID=A0A024FWV3_9STRA|nr:unnamed protein product [Albugo candida]|eukprot:CCI11402.1 unnamed protein product [Albugo candida]